MLEQAALQADEEDPIRTLVGIETTPRWSMRAVILATLIAIGIGLAFLLLYRFYMIVFLFFVAFSLATALKPVVSWLQTRNIPPLLGILPIYLGSLGLLVGFLWFVGPIIINQLGTVVRELPTHYDSLRLYIQNSPSDLLRMVGALLPRQLSLPLTQLSATTESADPIGLLGEVLSKTGKAIFMLIGVLLLAYYWLLEGDNIIRRIVLRTRLEQREQIRALISEVEGKIGGYFRGQLLLCLMIGVLCLVAFLIIGVPNAMTLALINGVTEAIPILGPTLGAIPAILITLSIDPIKTIWVIVAMVIIQSVESNFLVPRVMDKSVGINPLLTILSIAAFGLLFGFVGAILAIPLAAILQILLNRLLFSTPPTEDVLPTNEAGPLQTRTHFAVLRLEAHELAQDVRKQARNNTEAQTLNTQIEEAEDMIEMVANNLENYLVQQERG
jgi:predicted PurR-regulated permease PerM